MSKDLLLSLQFTPPTVGGTLPKFRGLTLSSVFRGHIAELGARALKALVALEAHVEGAPPGDDALLRPVLVVRDSCGSRSPQ
mgnify:CR=1 FL=1